MTTAQIWPALERNTSLTATTSVWRSLMGGGDEFDSFQAAFLQKLPDHAKTVFCEKCYCAHEVIHQTPEILAALVAAITPAGFTPALAAPTCPAEVGRRRKSDEGGPSTLDTRPSTPPLVAACRCERFCPDIVLSPADIEQWSLNWPRLARALCKAFSLNSQFTDLKLFNTHQIGTWSADAVPVILTIQSERHQLRSTICELTQRLRRPYILLAPTNANLDITCQEFLANANAAFFPLETTVRLTDSGTLLPVKSPGELFAKFTPEEKLPEDAAMRAFAIAKSLDTGETVRKAPVFTVFRLYCMENMSVEEVAKELECSKATVSNRLQTLRKKTGTDPEKLRAYSAQFTGIEKSLSDPRAKRIHRQSAIYDEPSDDES